MTTIIPQNPYRSDGSGPSTFVNNRVQGWSYDADGRALIANGYYVYDAAGRVISFGNEAPYKTEQQFSGDGLRAKTVARRFNDETDQWMTEKITYYVTSTVLGGEVVTELSEQGLKERTLVHAGGSVLASQIVSGGTQSVEWEHRDPGGSSFRATNAAGEWTRAAEMDAVGANAGLAKPFTWSAPNKIGLLAPYPGVADMLNNPGGACTVDRMPMPCEMVSPNNSAECPNGDCGPKQEYNPATKRMEWRFFASSADGRQGYLPLGATSNGDGGITLGNGDEGWGYLYSSFAGSLPQNSGPVRLGGTDQLKTMIEQTSSSCREAVKKLLTEIAAETKSKLTSTDPMELFSQITSQKGGGGLYADITQDNMRERLPADSLRGYTPIASGSGEAWRFWSYSEKSVQRIAIIYLRYSTGTPQSTGLVMAAYLVTAFHEMTHIARKDGTMISHDQMNSAAVALRAASFDDYIEKHCLDKKYWGRP